MTELIEAVARKLYRNVYGYNMPVDSETPFNERFLSHAQAALTAITNAGYRIVKDEVVACKNCGFVPDSAD